MDWSSWRFQNSTCPWAPRGTTARVTLNVADASMHVSMQQAATKTSCRAHVAFSICEHSWWTWRAQIRFLKATSKLSQSEMSGRWKDWHLFGFWCHFQPPKGCDFERAIYSGVSFERHTLRIYPYVDPLGYTVDGPHHPRSTWSYFLWGILI